MSRGKPSKIDTEISDDGANWPFWAKLAASVGLAVHLTALLAAALAWPPSSGLEAWVAERFAVYYQLLDQGYAYRYYAPEPGPTPVIRATVRYADGRPEQEVRIPARGVKPRLRYQRQLALATHLTEQYTEVKASTGDGSQSLVARSFARHIAHDHPGCASVTLFLQWHLIPNLVAVHNELEQGKRIDIDAEDYYTAPERIGEFPCDGL